MKTSAAMAIVFSFLLAACSSAVTSEKIAQVHPGMSPAQVEKLLGPPARIDQAETTGLKGQVYHYPSDKDEGCVIFLNDAVFKATFTAGTTP